MTEKRCFSCGKVLGCPLDIFGGIREPLCWECYARNLKLAENIYYLLVGRHEEAVCPS